jgi:hypothetical protein
LIALTLGVSIKWVDNLLSHHHIPGVTRSRQGVQRQLSDEGLIAVEIVRILTDELQIPVARAAEICRVGMLEGTIERFRFETHSSALLTLDVAEIDKRLRARMLDAVESIERIPRGRPRSPAA